MSRILVTGVAGFIGSKVAELLLSDGHTVIGVDNLNTAYDVRLKKWRINQIDSNPHFHFHHLDICDGTTLQGIFDPSLEAVINLAARTGVRQSVNNPLTYYESNVTGTLVLLELCKHHGVKKFVLASTSSLYGVSNRMPYHENQSTDLPLSPYSASKKAAEALCHSYHHLYSIDITILRYFTVYGPAGRPDMSPFRFVQWIAEDRPVMLYGDGSQSRDFTFIDDIAQGTIASLRPVGYEVINLGSNKPIALMDAIQLIEQQIGKKAKLHHRNPHPTDIHGTWADIRKAEKMLDWKPETSIRSGMQELVDWYFQNRYWAAEIITQDE